MSTLKQFREKDTEKEIELFPDGRTDKDVDGRYKLIRLLGRGAMGSVFSAVRLEDGAKVAIKIIDRRDARHQVAVKRFQLEAETAMRINHQNIVKIIEKGECSEHGHFIVLELLKGVSLARWMDNTEVPNKNDDYLNRLVSFCVEVCDGLQAAHDKGVVHRDIKPSNVFLHGEEFNGEEVLSPKILDFGVAKILDVEQAKLTKTGDLCGTSEYIAPEIILGEKPSAQSDVYSLGILLYYGMTGTTPFRDEFEDLIITRAVTEECEVPKPSTINPAVPKRLESICLKAVERDKARRYRNAVEMGVDLRRLRDDPEGEDDGPGTRGRISVVAAVLGGVVLLSLGLVFGLDLFGEPEEQDEASTGPARSAPTETEEPPSVEPGVPEEAPVPVEAPQEEAEDTVPASDDRAKQVAPDQAESKGAGGDAPREDDQTEAPKASAKTTSTPAQSTEEILDEAESALSGTKFARARELFAKAISIQPGNARAHYGLGRTYYQQLDHANAAKSIEKAVKLRPNPKWRTFLGKVYKAMGKRAEAEKTWREVLKDNPGFAPAERELDKLGSGAQG